MDNGFFLVKFSSIDEYEFAKYGGPWLIYNDYLTKRPWKPNFDSEQDDLKNLLVWVRIPGLPIEYYDLGTREGWREERQTHQNRLSDEFSFKGPLCAHLHRSRLGKATGIKV